MVILDVVFCTRSGRVFLVLLNSRIPMKMVELTACSRPMNATSYDVTAHA